MNWPEPKRSDQIGQNGTDQNRTEQNRTELVLQTCT